MFTVKLVSIAVTINTVYPVTVAALNGKVQTSSSPRTAQEIIWAQRDYKSVHYYQPSYTSLIEKSSINSVRQNNSCTEAQKIM